MGIRRFTLFHLSLVPLQQPAFDTTQMSREEWLRHALAESFEFDHRGGKTLYWVPHASIKECMFGVVQQIKGHAHHELRTKAVERQLAKSGRAPI